MRNGILTCHVPAGLRNAQPRHAPGREPEMAADWTPRGRTGALSHLAGRFMEAVGDYIDAAPS